MRRTRRTKKATQRRCVGAACAGAVVEPSWSDLKIRRIFHFPLSLPLDMASLVAARVEEATSEQLLMPDWAKNLELSDLINLNVDPSM